MFSVFLAIVSTLLVLVGLVGTILPFIPGVLVAWLGLFIFAMGTGFERLSIITTIIFFIAMLLTVAFDIFVPRLIAGKFRTIQLSTVGGSLGSFLGKTNLGPLGTIFGPFLGTLLGELIDGWKHSRSLKTGIGLLLGIIAGIVIKIIVVLIMLGFLIASWF